MELSYRFGAVTAGDGGPGEFLWPKIFPALFGFIKMILSHDDIDEVYASWYDFKESLQLIF